METDLDQSLLLIAQFSERANPLGTQVAHCSDSQASAAVIAQAAATAGAESIPVSRQLADRACKLIHLLDESGIPTRIVHGPDQARDQPVGLSLARCAVAETGSVLLDERHLSDRATSLMTLHSIVVVATEDVVPSLDSTPGMLREIVQESGASYVTFVTGPSRTADIEMSLTVGVQGPGQVTVLFVDDLT
jgi:L-lactate dehydrogenase complex protein LldG